MRTGSRKTPLMKKALAQCKKQAYRYRQISTSRHSAPQSRLGYDGRYYKSEAYQEQNDKKVSSESSPIGSETMTILDDRVRYRRIQERKSFKRADIFTWKSTTPSTDKTEAPKPEKASTIPSIVPPMMSQRPENAQNRIIDGKALPYQDPRTPEAYFHQTPHECIAGFRRFLIGRRRLLDASDEEIAGHYVAEYLLSYRSCSDKLQAAVGPQLIAEGVRIMRERRRKTREPQDERRSNA